MVSQTWIKLHPGDQRNIRSNSCICIGLPTPKSPVDNTERPVISRKPSSLDYNEDLALPMPKPRHMREEQSDVAPWLEEEDSKSNLLKKRCVTDPVIPAHGSHSVSLSRGANDSKKRSRLGVLRSKFSFKDLGKECAKEETASQVSTQSMDDPKARGRSGITSNNTASFSPSTHSSRLKPKPTEENTKSTSIGSTTSSGSQGSFTPTRIPLPPSGTFSNIQGTMAAFKSLGSRQISALGTQPPVPARSASVKDKIEKPLRPEAPVLPRDFQPEIVVTRPSFETSQKKLEISSPSTPTPTPPKYPVTRDSPPSIQDLCEGDGKVKYLPKDWLEGSDYSSQIKTQPTAPSAYSEHEACINSLPDYLPSFHERLQQAKTPPNQSASPEMRAHNTAVQIDDIVDMVRSIQKQTDSGISCISKKLEDLTSWIGDQLNNQIKSVSDLGRVNSDLFAKQCQITREMMKFQLDIRVDIGVMEKQLSNFESGVLDALQIEVKNLARSYEELNHRTGALIAKYSSDDNQSFMELQRQKNAEIENEIALLKSQPSPLAAIAPLQAQSLHRLRLRPSESSIGSTEPLIRQAATATLPSVPPIPSPPTRTRMVSFPENKPATVFPRSVSLSKKGFLKGIKDMASTSPEPKEKVLDKAKSTEDPKKWNVFGFRRRREQNENSNSSKFPWSSPRRGKDASTAEELSSSRSSSPTPPIMRNISSPLNFHAIDGSNIHPAFRGTLRKGASLEDGSMTAPLETSTQPSVSSPLHSCDDKGSTDNVLVVTTSNQEASVEASQSPSFHTEVQESPSVRSSNEDTQKMQLSGASGFNSQEWDRISLREPNSPN